MEKHKTKNSPFEGIPVGEIEIIIRKKLGFYLNPENFLIYLKKELKTKKHAEIVKNLNKLGFGSKEINKDGNNFCTYLLNILIQEDIDILDINFKEFYFEVVKITKEEMKTQENIRKIKGKTSSNIIQLMPV